MVLTAERRRLLSLEVPIACFGLVALALSFLFAVRGIPHLPPAGLVLLGIPAPLSGMTRSFVALASGDVAKAFVWHPLGPFVFAACVGAGVIAVLSWTRARRLETVAWAFSRPWVWTVMGLLIGAAWIRQIVVLG